MKRLWKCVKLSEYERIAYCREETPQSFIQYDDGNRLEDSSIGLSLALFWDISHF